MSRMANLVTIIQRKSCLLIIPINTLNFPFLEMRRCSVMLFIIVWVVVGWLAGWVWLVFCVGTVLNYDSIPDIRIAIK